MYALPVPSFFLSFQVGGGAQWLGPQIVGPLLQKLVGVTERKDWEEHNLRVTAYEAINMVRPEECHGYSQGLRLKLSLGLVCACFFSMESRVF